MSLLIENEERESERRTGDEKRGHRQLIQRSKREREDPARARETQNGRKEKKWGLRQSATVRQRKPTTERPRRDKERDWEREREKEKEKERKREQLPRRFGRRRAWSRRSIFPDFSARGSRARERGRREVPARVGRGEHAASARQQPVCSSSSSLLSRIVIVIRDTTTRTEYRVHVGCTCVLVLSAACQACVRRRNPRFAFVRYPGAPDTRVPQRCTNCGDENRVCARARARTPSYG